MISYSRISIDLKEEASRNAKQLYKDFKEKCEKYCIHNVMELYRIPIMSEEYQYAKLLIDLGESEVEISESFEKVYNKEDYKNAAAYLFAFTSIIYGYDDESTFDYYKPCCDSSKYVHGGTLFTEQFRDYRVPKKEFAKKKYGQLDIYQYAVSEDIKEELIKLGALNEDFRPVTTAKGEIVCYQVQPVNEIISFGELNHMKAYYGCKQCKHVLYDYDDRKPFIINQTIIKSMKVLNKTIEKIGFSSSPIIFINKEAYEYLHKQYPRMQFQPVFLKN